MNPATLRAGALELPYRYGDLAGARRDLGDALDAAPELDLVALAECALTGYVSPDGDFDLASFAEPADGPTATTMRALARERAVALGFPLIEADGGRRFNSYLVADATGAVVAHYRKRHPWYPERWASPGDLGTPVFALRGVTLTIAVCFDVHFVADDAREALDAADALLFPSAWVDEGADDVRETILGDLARMHGLWVLNPNWGRGAPVRYGPGRSRIITPDGAVAAMAPRRARGALVTATLTGGRARRGT